jgi:hypothetical protein
MEKRALVPVDKGFSFSCPTGTSKVGLKPPSLVPVAHKPELKFPHVAQVIDGV